MVSSQIAKLEKAVGKPLFDRVGRGVVLTETGRLVLSGGHTSFEGRVYSCPHAASRAAFARRGGRPRFRVLAASDAAVPRRSLAGLGFCIVSAAEAAPTMAGP